MRILVYEHLTACRDPSLPPSLVREGAAMLAAVTADFADCPGVEVLRFDPGRDFAEAASEADAVLLIAPENDGVLTNLASRVERQGRPLLSPSAEFCRWASDKSQVAADLQRQGVPMPRGRLWQPGEAWSPDFAESFVLKPNDGCGSQGLRHFGRGDAPQNTSETVCRVEEFVPGQAASVALLRGPGDLVALAPCSQKLDAGTFAYLGGSCPLHDAFAARAERLALGAAQAMPEWHGYIGLDLVLGDAADGSQDYVIEVNPRLTTSYVGLRAVYRNNLATAMLDILAGRRPEWERRSVRIEFDAAGNVKYLEKSFFGPVG